MKAEPLFDVVEVEIDSGIKRTIARAQTEETAEAFIKMAVMRRGVEHHFYKAIPAQEPIP